MSTLSGNSSISDRNKTRFRLLNIHTYTVQCMDPKLTHLWKTRGVCFGSTYCTVYNVHTVFSYYS